MRKFLALALGKSILKVTRILKIGGGSAAPGLYALKVDPDLVIRLIGTIPNNIVITGTNGKTTTSRMLAHFAQKQGIKVIRNSTGSNLERGIASSLLTHSNLLTGKIKADLGIWELDEAAFNLVAPKISPQIVVFLNAFRDQLDRYGEVDTVIKRWQQTLAKMDKNTVVFLNSDDDNLHRLKETFKGKVYTFEVKENKIKGEKQLKSRHQTKQDVAAENIVANGLDQTTFTIAGDEKPLSVTLPLPGVYNIYNFLAAFSAALAINLSKEQVIESVKDFSSAFGRVEKITLPSGKQAYIFLIKNPTGATEVFQTITANITSNDRLLVALNDNLADGTDVSWIWDAKFEKLKVQSAKLKVYCTGTRTYDLALRFKYAGIEPESLTVIPSLKNALEDAQRDLKGRLFILPTYTALLNLQKILAAQGIKQHYWRES